MFGDQTRKIGVKHPQTIITGRNYAIPANRPKLPTPRETRSRRKHEHERQSANDSSLKDILNANTQIGEDVEFKVLKDYFETTSYSEIINDPDFKDYLSRKNYGDILDYLDANNELETSEVSSLYKESNYLQPRRVHKSKSTSNLYDNLSFYNTYDRPDARMWPSPKEPAKSSAGLCNSLKRLRRVFHSSSLVDSTPPVDPSECRSGRKSAARMDKYNEIKKFCQLLFDENHAFDEKVKSATLGKRFSEKKYRKLLERFVKAKGFTTVDEYVYAKFGSILDQTVCSTLTGDTAVKPEYSKRYMENIPKRYHVTKQQFLEADFSKNLLSGSGNLYQSSQPHLRGTMPRNGRRAATPPNMAWTNEEFKMPAESKDIKFGDHCFQKRYCNQDGGRGLGCKYRTMAGGGRRKEIPAQGTRVNSETLPSYWPRRRHQPQSPCVPHGPHYRKHHEDVLPSIRWRGTTESAKSRREINHVIYLEIPYIV